MLYPLKLKMFKIVQKQIRILWIKKKKNADILTDLNIEENWLINKPQYVFDI